ncbi:hypothetical protein [Paracoccus everestensis]|uniref:hypothetical protein n=1 Tax=Paracoccus everestensis TaxID=2903900 RepID=UPI001F295C8A|nr:hypothetical protein [Paracoccus everestensis]
MSTNARNLKNIFKPTNSKFYWLRIKINGVLHRESLRTTSQSVAAKKAKGRITELRGLAEAGELDWTFSTGLLKFYEVLDQESSGWGAQTRKRYRTSLRQILRVIEEICEDLGHDVRTVMAAEIKVATVSEFVSRRRSDGVTISTINRDLTAFGQLMTAMRNDGWIEENPVKHFEKQ